jgi:5-methylcytosine-specific restriction endonuclease McrA
MNKELKHKIKVKYNGRCAYCGIELDNTWQVDHMISKREYSSQIQAGKQPKHLKHLTLNDVDHIDNLTPACKPCNNYKHSYSVDFFRETLKTMLNKKHEYLFKSKTKMQVALNMGTVKLQEWDGVFYFETYELTNINQNAVNNQP